MSGNNGGGINETDRIALSLQLNILGMGITGTSNRAMIN